MLKPFKTTFKEFNFKYVNILRKYTLINTGIITIFSFNFAIADQIITENVSNLNITKPIYYYSYGNGDNGWQTESIIIKDSTYENITKNDGSGNENYGSVLFTNNGFDNQIINSIFRNNTTTQYSGVLTGATMQKDPKEVATINIFNSKFENNHAYYDGGAIGNYGNLTVSNSLLIGNTANYNQNNEPLDASSTSDIMGGGAIALGGVSNTSIVNTTFSQNSSGTYGGAIGTRLGKDSGLSKAKLDIDGTFKNNSAYISGGAIYNTFYADNGLNKGNGVTIKGTFEGNTAGQDGGAIYNDGSKDRSNNDGGLMTINDSIFKSNTAGSNGGAIYNSGILNINSSGYTEFIQNSAENGGAIYSTGTTTFHGYVKFINNSASDRGGAIFVKEGMTTIGENSLFQGNTASSVGGAIDVYKAGETGIRIKSGTRFIANESYTDGGAMANFNLGIIDNNVLFEANKAQKGAINDIQQMGGGAIALGGVSKTFINGAIFTNNWSGFNGGAIATRRSEVGNLKNAGLSIANSTFINNKAEGYLYNDNLYGGNGGAIFNSFYKGAVLDSNDNVVLSDSNTSISSSTFSLNEAIGKGGAIYNSEAEVTSAKPSILILTDNNFNSNISAIAGGAIYNANDATIYFKGTNKFFGNKADGILNDIYNDGILNISGNLTLDGGINGNGSVIFEDNSLLTAELQKTTITASSITFDGNNSINLIAGNLVDGSYDFISTTTLNGITNVNLVDNPIYNLTMLDNGKVNISKKSNEEIKNNLNTNEQTANTIISLISIQGNGTENGNRISNLILNAIQNGNTSVAVQAVKDFNPTPLKQVLLISQSVNSLVSKAVDNHIDIQGMSSGDIFNGGSVWAQGLYNYAKQNSSSSGAGFNADTTGLAFGVDGKATDNLTLGIGYSYNKTDAKAENHKTDIDGFGIFTYGSYKMDKTYINTMLSYNIGKYEEKKSPMGVDLKADYDVNSFYANVMSGYNFDNGFTPEGGIRYLLVKQNSYNDGVQEISSDTNNILTGVAGVKYKKTIQGKTWAFKPNIHLAATYDVLSDNSKASINVIGGSNYEITGKRLSRFGVETGIGLVGTIGDWDINLEYNAGFKKDYQNHTGLLKVIYNF